MAMSLPDDDYCDSGCIALRKKIQQWLEWDKNMITRCEIEEMHQRGEWNKLSERLMNRLAFGTAGLRGPMQAGFNAINDVVIIQTAQGLCKYLQSCYPNVDDQERGIIVGYDGRHNSEKYAKLTACVFICQGIPVYLYSKTIATPFIPFGITVLNCLAGVMVTASHNPKEDNGYKVYWSNGAQIIPPHDKYIQMQILESLCPLDSSWNLSILANKNFVTDPYITIMDSYMEKLLETIPKKFLANNELTNCKFVYSAMHGVGYPFIKKAFRLAKLQPVVAVVEQRDPDPNFSTVKYPNPEEGKSSLQMSIDLAEKSDISMILANDPDADRLAYAEKDAKTGKWKVFSGNELGALLGWWSIQYYLEKNPKGNLSDCYILGSTVSSKMLGSMAEMDGFNYIETLTGFKWMGNKAVELMESKKTVLFAFEEAIGFMFSPNVLDKDGVSAACHLATMCCYLKTNGNLTLHDKLKELYHQYGYHYAITSYLLCYQPEKIKIIFERIRNWDNIEGHYPDQIGEYKIKTVRDLTTGIDTAQPDGKALLPSSSSTQMITFSFENGVVITLRTSGTEPKIKYYAEMCAKPEEKDWNSLQALLNKMVDDVVEEFLQPELNQLKRKID